MKIHGIVLAGGLSRRMQGPDKADVTLAGRSLLDHVLHRLEPQCDGLVLSANRDASRFAALSLPVVADDIPGFAGPVAGILAALEWIAEHRPDTHHAVSCAVDTPFLPHDFVERLRAAARRGGTPTACGESGGRRHPVAALWPVASRHALRRLVEEQRERRVSTILERLGCCGAEWPTEPFDPFVNINTPADLDLARRLICPGKMPDPGA